MLDIRWMRENREALADAMRKLNDPDAPWELALDLDERRRRCSHTSRRCAPSATPAPRRSACSSATRRPRRPTRSSSAWPTSATRSTRLDLELRDVEAEFEAAMLRIPNPPEDDVPVAPDESGNVVVRQEGEPPNFDFTPAAPLGTGRDSSTSSTWSAARASPAAASMC